MNKKLNAKDFILIGVLTALMWIICMIISTVMSIAGPVTNVFYPAVVAIPNGIVMMLLLAKVPKKGVFTICGTIQGILFLLVGGFWLIPVALIVGGVICDFFDYGKKRNHNEVHDDCLHDFQRYLCFWCNCRAYELPAGRFCRGDGKEQHCAGIHRWHD